MVQYSTASGALMGSMFTEDNAVLQMSAAMSVVHPAKLDASLARYFAEGLPDSTMFPVVGSWLSALDLVISKLDLDSIHADHLITAADMYHTEPPVVLWCPSATLLCVKCL